MIVGQRNKQQMNHEEGGDVERQNTGLNESLVEEVKFDTSGNASVARTRFNKKDKSTKS